MIEPQNRELRAVRIETAISICLRFPSLYKKINYPRTVIVDPNENLAGKVLIGLLKLEPCIEHILDFYYKRELR